MSDTAKRRNQSKRQAFYRRAAKRTDRVARGFRKRFAREVSGAVSGAGMSSDPLPSQPVAPQAER